VGRRRLRGAKGSSVSESVHSLGLLPLAAKERHGYRSANCRLKTLDIIRSRIGTCRSNLWMHKHPPLQDLPEFSFLAYLCDLGAIWLRGDGLKAS
jgi:hypothetical protein